MIAEYMGETVLSALQTSVRKVTRCLGLVAATIVDATMIGCMASFMNHCCWTNAYTKVINVDTDQGRNKKIVFANCDIDTSEEINAGEEITFDYKFPIEDGSFQCTCGAPNCIGHMN